MFDIKSLPSTSWLGWVEKTLEDQQWGPWHGKLLNTLYLRLKHCLAASARAGCTEGIEVVPALSLVPVAPQKQQLHPVPDLTPTPLPAGWVLTVPIPDLLCPLSSCSVPGLSYLLLSQEEHMLLCWLSQPAQLDRRWILLGSSERSPLAEARHLK